MKNKKPRGFYKYISLKNEKEIDDKIIDGIKAGKLRFTQPSVLNDRFEGNWANQSDAISVDEFKKRFDELKNDSGIDIQTVTSDDIICLTNEIGMRLTPRVAPGLFSFSDREKQRYSQIYKKDVETLINERTDLFVILSLTTSYDKQLLWSHYANMEKGFVIEFDSNHEYFNDIRKVKYSNKRISINKILNNWYRYSDFDKYDEIDLWIINSLLNKSKVWKYEEEYRLIRKRERSDPDEIFCCEIPFSAWKSIYLGPEIDSKYEYEILRYFKRAKATTHINIYNVFRKRCNYGYDIFLR